MTNFFQEAHIRGALGHLGRRGAGLALLALSLTVFTSPARGQAVDGGRGGARIYQEQLRVQLDEQAPQAREQGPDAGGWFTFTFLDYNDEPSGKWRTLREYDLRLWASMNLRGVHRAYVRGLFRYDDWNSGDNPDDDGGDDHDCIVERAWYQFDYGQWLQNQTGLRPPAAFKVKVGREFTTIGTAFTLSMPMDLIQFDGRAGNWDLKALLGKTIHDTNNIDDSEAVSDHQDRCLWGAEVAYRGITNHRPFIYFLNNDDHTGEHPNDPDQSYDYSSRYVGIGSEGTIVSPRLRYLTEAVGEWGKTYSDGVTAGRDNISAMGLDALLEYSFDAPKKPKVFVEYMFGSGDSDRTSLATSTVGGNTAGTDDHAFNAFGFRDTGVALAPAISNLHIYSAGASFYPLEKHTLFKRMECGTKGFWYQKARQQGAISDTSATKSSDWVGFEWDVYCDWRITSDLTFTLRYGTFFPGSAYEDRDCREFVYTGLTYSF